MSLNNCKCSPFSRTVMVLCILTVQCRPQLPRRKGFDRAPPPSEFAGRQSPVAVEQAQKTLRRGFSFLLLAFCAGGKQRAVGLAAPPDTRDHMVAAAHAG